MLRTILATISLLAPAAIAAAANGNEGDPVEGRVRETRVVDGVRYASVSSGSDHGVTRGMRLSVFGGKTGRELLGTIEVTAVEPGECIGRLSGDRAAEVRENDRVRPEPARRRHGDERRYADAAGR
jgi:hypothetical protein